MKKFQENTDYALLGAMPFFSAIIAVVYVAAGVAFYVYSGQAEGFFSPRLGFILVVLTSIPLGSYLLIALIFRFRWPSAKARWLIVIGIGVSYLLVILGYRLDGVLTAETMARGDRLIQDIEDYQRATGAYPTSLNEVAMGGRTLPVPALDRSAFSYQQTTGGGYEIAFPSVAFLTCRRTSLAADWTCDD